MDFSGAIKKIYGEPLEGDVVDVYDNKGTFLGVGHYQPGSIAVRILAFENITPDADFSGRGSDSAITYRKAIGIFNNADLNVFRLVHAEGDNLPGFNN